MKVSRITVDVGFNPPIPKRRRGSRNWRAGGPHRSLASPEPAENEVLVKVAVISINPHDQKTRDWGLFITKPQKFGSLPACLTHDVVGKVVALGPDVTKYAIGDRVFSQGRFTTNWNGCGSQEYATVDVFTSAEIPDNISDDEAAGVPINIAASLIDVLTT